MFYFSTFKMVCLHCLERNVPLFIALFPLCNVLDCFFLLAVFILFLFLFLEIWVWVVELWFSFNVFYLDLFELHGSVYCFIWFWKIIVHHLFNCFFCFILSSSELQLLRCYNVQCCPTDLRCLIPSLTHFYLFIFLCFTLEMLIDLFHCLIISLFKDFFTATVGKQTIESEVNHVYAQEKA